MSAGMSGAEILLINPEPGSRPPRGAPAHCAPKRFLQDIFETTEATSAAALNPIGTPREGLEAACIAKTPAAPAAAKPLEALKSRLALSVDLPAIVGLAFGFIAHDLVGRIQFGETGGRPRVVLVGIRMQLLSELPECALDLSGTCAL
jgi:hypothetical protein